VVVVVVLGVLSWEGDVQGIVTFFVIFESISNTRYLKIQ